MRFRFPRFTPALCVTATLAVALLAPAAGAAPAGLSPAQQVWFDRMLPALDASANLANNFMRSNDSYTIGRDGGNYTEALWVAWLSTGDKRFLDRMYDLTQMARDSLRDAWRDGTTDGYTDWQWLIDPTNATYYGKDTNWLDESIASGNAALWMYAFNANRGLDARYGEAADFWRDWLENEFLAKWYSRVGGNPMVAWNTPYAAFYKPDTEPRSANWRLAWYLWKVTGNTFYRDRADQIVAELSGAQLDNPAHPLAWRWTKETNPASQSWQLVNYANYYVRVVIEMNLENQAWYSSDAVMKKFAGTFRDVVYANSKPALTAMTNDVGGGGSTAYALYAFNGLARWDSTGFLADLADKSITGAGNYAAGGLSKAARNDVYISAYAMLAVTPKNSVPTLVAAFSVTPGSDGSVRVDWELAPEAVGDGTNVYRIGADGVSRTLVNAQPVTGAGPHSLVDATPNETGTLAYELWEVSGGVERNLGRMSASRVANPSGVRLAPAAPNPFEGAVTLRFALVRSAHARLAVIDASGRRVRMLADGEMPAGEAAFTWDGRDDAGHVRGSGVYFAVLETAGTRLVQRIARVR